ncbi:hypothetical protein ACNSOL_12370 (plasmid) [Aliarcobacter lanthieri]|uniref:hypothetical protein n=1 Tax=Aliarcobacter lanthieri TaxID=1355374 RepID=UPI003AAB1F99
MKDYDEDMIEEIEDFEEEDFEEEIKEPKSTKVKPSNIELVKKHFDIVEVEEFELYELFTCKDLVLNKNVEYEVWLSVKIKKNKSEFFAGEILKNIEDLKPSFKDSAFNLSFYDFNYTNSYYLYDFDYYENCIPKNNQEMIEYVKECIELYFDSPNEASPFIHFKYSKIFASDPISDREMLTRLYFNIKLHFGVSNYDKEIYSKYDNIFSKYENKIIGKDKRFIACYYNAKLRLTIYDGVFIYYDLYDKEFCDWLRDKLKTPYAEPKTDYDIIKEQFLSYSSNFLQNNTELYCLINSSKNAIDFRNKLISSLDKDRCSGHFGSSNGPINDCYSFIYCYDLNRLSFQVEQQKEYRMQLGRDISSEKDNYFGDSTVFFSVKGNEVFEKMYEYLCIEAVSEQQKSELFTTTLSVAYDVGYSEEQISCFMNGSLF